MQEAKKENNSSYYEVECYRQLNDRLEELILSTETSLSLIYQY